MSELRRVTLIEFAEHHWGDNPPEDRGEAAIGLAVDLLRLGCGPKTTADLMHDPAHAAWIEAAKRLAHEEATRSQLARLAPGVSLESAEKAAADDEAAEQDMEAAIEAAVMRHDEVIADLHRGWTK